MTTAAEWSVAEIAPSTDVAKGLTLFQIEESLVLLAESAEQEGLTPEIEQALTVYLEGAAEKRDRVADFIHFCEGMAELAKAEVKRLQARQKHFEATAERVSAMVLLRRGRGYKNLRYLLLKCQRMAVTKTELVVFRKAA